jgi:large subunit ribosomal protein L32
MGVPKKRTSKMKRDMRRAGNNTLKTAVQVSKCVNCGAPIQPHRVCPACGFYKGKKVSVGAND